MHTMELRESRSSLAGVVMAIAAEGIALEQVERLASHGLPGGLGKALHGVKLPKEARGLGKASPASLEHKLEHKAGVSPASVKGLEKATGHGAGAAGAGAAGAGAAGGSSSGATGAPGGGGGAGAGASAGSGSGSGAGGAAAAGSGGGGGSAATAGSGGGAGGGAAASHAASSGGGGGGGGGSGSGHSGSSGGASASSRSAPNMGGGNPATSASASSSSASGAGWPDQTPSASSSASTVPAGSGAASTVPAGGGAASTVPAGSGAASTVPAGSGAASTVPAGGGAASTVPAGGGGVGTVASSAGTGGTVSGAVEGATNAAGGTGVAPIGVTGLLDSPNFTAPPAVRTWLESGGVDPRVVSMLDSVLAHHTIGVSNLEVLSSPVHVQSFDIVSVDGQPVGPDNFAARDLVTEIAAMDPTTRPDEIGTPWPIQSPGFFSNPTSANGLHLAFEMPGTNATPAQDAGYSGIDTGQPQPQMNYAIGAQPTPTAASYPAATYPAATYQAASPSAGAQQVEQLAGSGAAAPLGSSVAPAAMAKVQDMVRMADSLLGKPYILGGGHAGWAPSSGYDCSGFVSAVLHSGGYLNEPVATTNLPEQAGILSGPGKIVTIYDRALPGENGHVIICINGQFYESGGMAGPWGGGGGVEKIGKPSAAYLATFPNVLHPEGL
jgi:cell wall-associated NlpC family hydrolase